ncbi:MAG: preprotein translocase subunit SecE [bacterium]|nr:preprotein translocase subunit SecE [bacterium]
MNVLTKFLKEVRTELKKVSWPTREQTTQYTLVVIGVSVAIMLFLGALDYLFSYILNSFAFK